MTHLEYLARFITANTHNGASKQEHRTMNTDRPKPGRQYRLTGGQDSIAGGASWAASAVDPSDAERKQAAAEQQINLDPLTDALAELKKNVSEAAGPCDQPTASKPQPGPFDDLEPISTYTSDQAVADGVLVEAAPMQYGPAVMFTRGVFEAVNSEVNSASLTTGTTEYQRDYLQRAIPLIQDALMMCKAQPNRDGEPEHLWTKGLEGNVTGRDVWIGRNERGGITLMFPEDY